MDVRRVERIVRDVIAEYGFACTLIGVRGLEGRWRITVRALSGRPIEFDGADSTPVHLRNWIYERLDEECGD